MDLVIIVYFEDFQDIAVPPSINIYPQVDLDSFMSDI